MKLSKSALLLLFLAAPGIAAASKAPSDDLLLSGNEIDLLVGTPTGIAEPLDQRRTKYAPNSGHDFSGLLEDDLNADVSFAELDWSDAEDNQVSEDQTESQLLDLLTETEELESSEGSENKETKETAEVEDANSFDNIETEFKL